MPNLKDLLMEFDDVIDLYPFSTDYVIPPETTEGESEPEQIPSVWQDVGFRVLYPTMEVRNKIAAHGFKKTPVRVGRVTHFSEQFDGVKLCKYICDEVIKDFINVFDNGKPVPYDPKLMFKIFNESYPEGFDIFLRSYQAKIQKTLNQKQKKDKDFFGESENT